MDRTEVHDTQWLNKYNVEIQNAIVLTSEPPPNNLPTKLRLQYIERTERAMVVTERRSIISYLLIVKTI